MTTLSMVTRQAARRLAQCLSASLRFSTSGSGRGSAGFASAAGALRGHRTALNAPLRAAGLVSPAWLSGGVQPRAAAAAGRGYAASGLPPHTELGMPALSPTMSQGNIAAWKKKEGDEIAAGDVLCEVETDKATMEWEAQDEGFLAKILVPEGTKDIPVGAPVAVVVDDAGDVGAFSDYTPGAAPAAAAEPDEAPAQEQAPAEEGGGGGGGSGTYPPHTVMGLPALSPTMSQGNIASWKKKPGDEVAAGDSLAEIETDKATMDWESQDDGYVAALLVKDGAKDIAVGSPVLVFVEDQDAVDAFKGYTLEDAKGGAPKNDAKPAKPAPAEKPKKEEPQPSQPAKPAPAAPAQGAPAKGGRVIASPYARKLAREAGVDIANATGSGPGGRIVAADVQQLTEGDGGAAPAPSQEAPAQGAPAAGEWTDEVHSQVRRITAQRLLESKTSVPHYYLTVDVRMDKLLALRSQLNKALEKDGAKLSVNDLIVKASALALRKVPGVNASWFPEYIRQYHDVDVGVAVQTPGGLMVPVVRDADLLGLNEINATVRDLAAKAKANKLKPDEFSGGTFTISNLGMFGITEFSAIINPPQAAILAVGSSQPRVVASPDGGFAEAHIMAATLSCDHRVVDGALGAQWLATFRGYVEEPSTMLL
ncbi:hypothetical protein WJX81_003489 [Elliptochloris bilobata]|uniref:Acetyltransferase component of pyruvate dehydrogenase complex n=1 Tax=Elliptochloris bilobata TaxID=381761 RepID=A0AAW1R240_9CHLO